MDNKELEQKFKIFEQEIMQIQQQLQAIEQAIFDLSQVSSGLQELVGKTGEEIMAPIGRGIYVKANLLSEKLTVDVGGKNFVDKSIPETKKLIEDQLVKLEGMRANFEKELELINSEITKTMEEHQKAQKN